MNVPQQDYGGFYNPNNRWSHPGFSYKNTTASQNQNSFPKQPYQGNQFQWYPNPPPLQNFQPQPPPPPVAQFHLGASSQPPPNVYVPPHKKAQEDPNQVMMQQMMQMLGKLNSNMERWNATQEGAWNTFPAQPDPNPRGQHPGSTSGGPQQEQAKAIIVLKSERAIGKEDPPLNS